MLAGDTAAGQGKLYRTAGHVNLIVEDLVGALAAGIQVVDYRAVCPQDAVEFIGFYPAEGPHGFGMGLDGVEGGLFNGEHEFRILAHGIFAGFCP